MLLLVNTNAMRPLVGPIGLDYVAGAARRAGVATEVADLPLATDREEALRRALAGRSPRLVGLSFRNLDDCFWPSAAWFVPSLAETVRRVRALTDAPIVLGGVGVSILPEAVLEAAGADFAVRGDGEPALPALLAELDGRRRLDRVPGLVWRDGGRVRHNPPAWPRKVSLPAARDAVDNAAYFRLGGQAGVETKRGCGRRCIYCADPLAKGRAARLRPPAEVADEFEALLAQGIDAFHLCDGEFNLPREHALAVCHELARRRLGERVRWYAYLAVLPFDAELAGAMRRAGCAGIDFTADSADEGMLASYGHAHRRDNLAGAACLCRENGIAVMFDLLLGGPGETPRTAADTIGWMKRIGPDCVGAALGMRLYPGTRAAQLVAAEGPLETNPGIRRNYDGPADLLRPTFYIAPALGERADLLVRELIGNDARFFPPAEFAPSGGAGEDHNYNDNAALEAAIAAGARGAYWDILRRRRAG